MGRPPEGIGDMRQLLDYTRTTPTEPARASLDGRGVAEPSWGGSRGTAPRHGPAGGVLRPRVSGATGASGASDQSGAEPLRKRGGALPRTSAAEGGSYPAKRVSRAQHAADRRRAERADARPQRGGPERAERASRARQDAEPRRRRSGAEPRTRQPSRSAPRWVRGGHP